MSWIGFGYCPYKCLATYVVATSYNAASYKSTYVNMIGYGKADPLENHLNGRKRGSCCYVRYSMHNMPSSNFALPQIQFVTFDFLGLFISNN